MVVSLFKNKIGFSFQNMDWQWYPKFEFGSLIQSCQIGVLVQSIHSLRGSYIAHKLHLVFLKVFGM